MADREFQDVDKTTRQELLAALAELGDLFPDWRMGQTLANLAMAAGRSHESAVWDLEDHEALAAARHLLERNAGRREAASQAALVVNSLKVELTR